MTTKTVADKLLIKPNTTLWVSHPDRLDLVGPLPEGVRTVDTLEQAATGFIFGDDSTSLRSILAEHADELKQPPALWVAYPKGNKTDMNRDTLWPIVAEYGMRPISQIAVDNIWSALRFRPLKEGETQFTGGRGQ
jgi:hypothetical protein